MSPMHFAAADRLVADQRAAHEAAASRGRLRRLVSRRSRSRTTLEPESPVALTLASYRVEAPPQSRMRPVA
jgi:hypothetical protein